MASYRSPTPPDLGSPSSPVGSHGITPSGTLAPALKAALALFGSPGPSQAGAAGGGGSLHQYETGPGGAGSQGGGEKPVHAASPHAAAGGAPEPAGQGQGGVGGVVRSKHRHSQSRGGARPDPVHPVPEPDPRVAVRQKLKARATKLGLPTLPGSGSITMATRYIEGGRETVLGYIRLAAMNGNDSAMTWWHAYEDLSQYDQLHVSYDDICAATGVQPKAILMAMAGAGFDANCDIANLLSAHLHPSVVVASAKQAVKPNGIEDRKLLFQHSGFIPVPKGTQITINNSSHAQANAAAAAQATSLSNPSVPSFLQDVDDLGMATKAVQGEIIEAHQKALPPATEISDEVWEAQLAAAMATKKAG
jgi:hypothetical protein